MKYEQFPFRLADEILRHRDEWHEFQRVLSDLDTDHVLRCHQGICARGGKIPAGGQSAINAYFRERLSKWEREPRLFASGDKNLRKWKMDFVKNGVGIEISFNHAEAIPWTFSRLNIAGESERVQPNAKIVVGVAVFATDSLKRWAKMDSAVGTYEVAIAWLREMKPILPIPMLVVGLDASAWKPTGVSRGTKAGLRTF